MLLLVEGLAWRPTAAHCWPAEAATQATPSRTVSLPITLSLGSIVQGPPFTESATTVVSGAAVEEPE